MVLASTEIFNWLALGILTIIFGYVFVRASAFAYFRTKLEYLRSALRELRKENNSNG